MAMRGRVLVAAGVVSAAVLAGCGDEPSEQVSTEKTPMEAFQSASEQTAGADEPFRMSMSMEFGATDNPCAAMFGAHNMTVEADVQSIDPEEMALTDPTTGQTAI